MSDDTKKIPPKPVDAGLPGERVPRISYGDWTEEESSTRMTDPTLALQPQTPPRQQARALLTVISGPTAGRAFSLRDGETVIGRGREAHLRFDDAGASRAHARITFLGESRYVLEDLNSTNGTFIAGRRIERATELRSGDRINVGPNIALSFALLDPQAEQMAHQLYESSVRDTLTKAHNRRYLIERLTSEIAYARRHSTPLAAILLDIDHFKQVNDTYGHLAGDDVLREVSALVSRMIRTEDVFARYGGEEFIVLARGIPHINAGRFAERIRINVERLSIASEGGIIHVTLSAGFVSLDELSDTERTPEQLIRLADERLYTAKSAGRNRTCGS